MGCGQSQLGIIYPRKSKNKDGSKRNGEGSENEEEEEENEGESEADGEEAGLRAVPSNQLAQSPLLPHMEISSSQSDFFKMLDEKIEKGPDYDSNCEFEIAMEHARLCQLLQDWEMAKIRSRNRLLQAAASPARKPVTTHATASPRYAHVNGGLPPRYSVVTYDQWGGFRTQLA